MKHCLHISCFRWYQIIIDPPIFGSFSNMFDFLSWFLCLNVCLERRLKYWFVCSILINQIKDRSSSIFCSKSNIAHFTAHIRQRTHRMLWPIFSHTMIKCQISFRAKFFYSFFNIFIINRWWYQNWTDINFILRYFSTIFH